jgi:hypothetical protein
MRDNCLDTGPKLVIDTPNCGQRLNRQGIFGRKIGHGSLEVFGDKIKNPGEASDF